VRVSRKAGITSLAKRSRSASCTSSGVPSGIALTTLSVEAPGFYKKQGYDIAVTIDCDPPGVTRYYMTKKL